MKELLHYTFLDKTSSFDEAQCSYFLKVFILKMFLLWSIFYETLFFLKLYTPMEQAITKITLAMFRSLFLSKILKEI